MTTFPVWRVAPLLFGSGLCALLYQIVWQRELRLIFGVSTAASAAVLAIFIGGLGLGGLLLGRRADRSPSPLNLYAWLEFGVALSAAVTPLLIDAARALYIQAGGTSAFGEGMGTALRLGLAALVLGIPTLLMGGTLPAAVRAVQTDDDQGRRSVGFLYGINTLGAVVGSAVGTFVLLEALGARQTLWCAALINLGVAVVARSLARAGTTAETVPDSAGAGAGISALSPDSEATDTGMPVVTSGSIPAISPTSASPNSASSTSAEPSSPPSGGAFFALFAAAGVGFAFFLMEMVWYRMLGPLLGGTVFTFGLILTVALLGIGLGGGFYALRASVSPPTWIQFARICLLEAFFVALPFALGDQIALFALLTHPLGGAGFLGHLLNWAMVAVGVILPVAFLSGIQFPMLIGLIGVGRAHVGRQVGLAYGWNTVGAIVGSLAGGFGLLPLLTAPGCWQAVAILLIGIGVLALLRARGDAQAALRAVKVASAPGGTPSLNRIPFVFPAAVALVTGLLLMAPGPSAAWRHSPIGAGRVDLSDVTTPNEVEAWLRLRRWVIFWEQEGVESSVAMSRRLGLAFVVNGKIDGNAITDRNTQVMGGLLGSLLQETTRTALVIGLGTGSTAGWLGALPDIQTVDVVELEPAIIEVAKACKAVNHNAMENPKVHLKLGDAREVLLTSRQEYDLIFSEPSNPYRAGIASLFTQELYQAARSRLSKDGLFLQWLQAYEVDGPAVRSVYATLSSVFPSVHTWRLSGGDMLLVGSNHPVPISVARLRERLTLEPWKSALAAAWRTQEVEGILARYIAGPILSRRIAEVEQVHDALNTDDRPYIEFGFARTLGRFSAFHPRDVQSVAAAMGDARPALVEPDTGEGAVRWDRLGELRAQAYDDITLDQLSGMPEDVRLRMQARLLNREGQLLEGLATWQKQPQPPVSPTERMVVGEGLAERADDAALEVVAGLPSELKPEMLAVEARLLLRKGDVAGAARSLETLILTLREQPWGETRFIQRALRLSNEVATADRAAGLRIFDLLQTPFAVYAADYARAMLSIELLDAVGFEGRCQQAFAVLEPHVPFEEYLLKKRAQCYQKTGDPKLGLAIKEWERYMSRELASFSEGL